MEDKKIEPSGYLDIIFNNIVSKVFNDDIMNLPKIVDLHSIFGGNTKINSVNIPNVDDLDNK